MTALRLVVISASGAPSRSRPVLLEWITAQARRHPDFEVDVVDLDEIDVPDTLARNEELQRLVPLLDAADAFVFVTAEYNHGYPGGLKNFLDCYRREWLGKAVAFVSYGGRSSGLRAGEQLRQVIVEQHMVSVRDSIGFDTARRSIADVLAGDPSLGEAASAMLDQLSWWASALRNQRQLSPYKT